MFSGLIPFFSGVVFIGLFIILRVFEVRRGKRVFEHFRSHLDAFSTRLYRLFVFGEIPSTYRNFLSSTARSVFHQVVVLLVRLLRALERPLSRLNYRMRSTRGKDEQREPSPFLKDIGTSKNGEKPPDSL